jgi:CoA:oxalate CoA-transferase
MPLTGIRVLDLTHIVSGPFCTMLLGDFGADIVKVEALDGDMTRITGILGQGENPYFVNLNRNKRDIAVNLKTDAGKEIIRRLAKDADVLVENFRPGVMEKLGLGFEALRHANPRLIYAAVTGFGRTGPYRDRPAFDFIAQAMSGFMSLNGSADMDPIRVGIPISDTVAGLYAAFGILAALRERERTGRGQEVQASMVDGLISMFTFAVAAYFATGELPPRTGNDHMVLAAYGLFHASDGPIAIAPSTPKTWERLCHVLDLADMIEDPRFRSSQDRRAHRAEINGRIEERIATRRREEWIDILNREGVPCGPINTLREVIADSQVQHQEMVLESDQPTGKVKMPGFAVKLSDTPARLRRASPQLAEHTDEILREIGYSDEEIGLLRAQGVVLKPGGGV